MVIVNGGNEKIRDAIKPLFTTGGIGLNDDTPTVTDTGVTGGGTTIDACDDVTGWTESGDGDTIALNNTAGEYKEGSGCLNLPLTYSTGTASWEKTITSIDLTDKFIAIWFYVDILSDLTDASDTVQISLGTGGFTDSYYYNFSRDELTNGWNGLFIEVSNTSGSTGTGLDVTDCDRIKITVKADSSQSTNDMRMDFWRYYSPDTLGIDDSKHSLIVTSGDYYIKTIHQITEGESNGLEITESCDSDNSAMLSRQTFAKVLKSNTTNLQIDKYYYINP